MGPNPLHSRERYQECMPTPSKTIATMGSAIQIFDTNILRFVCVSDTHNDDCRDHIPDGDILLHAGDMTNSGSLEELQIAVDWIISLPHAVKVVVAGMRQFASQ